MLSEKNQTDYAVAIIDKATVLSAEFRTFALATIFPQSIEHEEM